MGAGTGFGHGKLEPGGGGLYADKMEGAQPPDAVGGRGLSWAETDYEGGWWSISSAPCDAETIYLTDGSYVYKSSDGGEVF